MAENVRFTEVSVWFFEIIFCPIVYTKTIMSMESKLLYKMHLSTNEILFYAIHNIQWELIHAYTQTR